MITHWDNRAITFSDRAYRCLLLVYPRRYRAEYGQPMAQLFQDQCRDAWGTARGWGLAGLWLRVLPDLIKTSVLEHFANWKGRKSMAENISALNRSRSGAFAVFIAVFAVVFAITFMSSVLITFILPESFASRTRIKIEPDTPASGANPNRVSDSYDPYFIQTQFEVIQSEAVLKKVVETLDLNTLWGKRYAGGEKLKTSETMGILRAHIDLRPVRNTSLIEIYAYSETPPEAALIANAIADAYRMHRYEQQHQANAPALAALKEQAEAQEKKIRDAQSEVERLQKEFSVTDAEAASGGAGPSLDADTIHRLQGELITFESSLAKEKTQLTELAKISPDQRRNVLNTAIGPDSDLSTALLDLNRTEQKLVELKREFAPDHPTYQNAQAQYKDAVRRVDTHAEGMMIGLSNRVAGLEAAVAKIKENLDSARSTDIAKTARNRPYYEAKVRLEEMQSFRRVLNVKLSSEQIDKSLPKSSLVEVIDRAVPAVRPARPNKPLNLFLGACIGTVLASFVGGGAALIVKRRRKNALPPAVSA